MYSSFLNYINNCRLPPLKGYCFAVLICFFTVIITKQIVSSFETANIMMIFLLSVVVIAVKAGRGPAALAAFINVLAMDFFYIGPVFTFSVLDLQYLMTFAIMLGVGLLIGQLTAGLRFAATLAEKREQRASSLFQLTQHLSAVVSREQVKTIGERVIRHFYSGEVVFLLVNDEFELQLDALQHPDIEIEAINWTFFNAKISGIYTRHFSDSKWLYMPLEAPSSLGGILMLKADNPEGLSSPEQLRHLQTITRQLAIALERIHFSCKAQTAYIKYETEQLRSTLLSAISHDLRTPLTALTIMAEQLKNEYKENKKLYYQIDNLVAKTCQINRLAMNLLEMARLQSGDVNIAADWQSIEEIVGSALRSVEQNIPKDKLITKLPCDLPLVQFDAMLIERVLVNLVENAIKYGKPPIEISVEVLPSFLVIKVLDHGDGIPQDLVGKEYKLFETFTRGVSESAQTGVGLGLAIVKAIVLAHKGTITAANSKTGGACFTIKLPRKAPPEIMEEEICSYQ
ncbi:DUF4118 domain-containing protein [Thorsellia anophelis]|uniref:histidine kinase n=1 Tax=Thorsellia anophelis DSM 18579 TaxID=1123402 RepID=A0A1H9ZQK2_9GAMM|nr:DUF4118 domain-containing protein [Thorsellia anophelis]SES83102.1 His Kinase A (phospho-acceptor) domain-containing protein [Thorsellia anophelis DSM 18579]